MLLVECEDLLLVDCGLAMRQHSQLVYLANQYHRQALDAAPHAVVRLPGFAPFPLPPKGRACAAP